MKITRRAALRSLAGAAVVAAAAPVVSEGPAVALDKGVRAMAAAVSDNWASICSTNAPVGWSNMHVQPLTLKALEDAVQQCRVLLSDGPELLAAFEPEEF